MKKNYTSHNKAIQFKNNYVVENLSKIRPSSAPPPRQPSRKFVPTVPVPFQMTLREEHKRKMRASAKDLLKVSHNLKKKK